MAREQLRYDKMVERALRGVVKDVLEEAARNGLPGNHHFYLTFKTSHPGVSIPDYLAAQYANEMTIVLQYQFFGLEVTEDGFAVTLSFNGQHERLSVAFAAITTFADPSVNFALQFQPLEAEEAAAAQAAEDEGVEGEGESATGEDAKRGEVVALDAFRKK